jgi:hypothetical protein
VFCSECGCQLETESVFCSNCGRRLPAEIPISNYRTSNPDPHLNLVSAPTRWPRYLIAVFLMASMAAGAAYVFKPELLGLPSPEGTIFKFVKAYNEKDINVMLSCLDSRIERGVKGVGNILGGLIGVNTTDIFEVFPMLSGILGNQPGNSQLENVDVMQKSISGSSASVVVRMNERMTLTNGNQVSALQLRFALKREGIDWRIIDIQTLR